MPGINIQWFQALLLSISNIKPVMKGKWKNKNKNKKTNLEARCFVCKKQEEKSTFVA